MTEAFATEAMAGRTNDLRRRAIAVAVAVLAALAVWALGELASSAQLAATRGPDEMTINSALVVTSALTAGLLGWAALALIQRLSRKPRRTWLVVSTVVLVLSLGAPLGQGVDVASRMTLTLMHLVVGAVLIPGLARTVQTERG